MSSAASNSWPHPQSIKAMESADLVISHNGMFDWLRLRKKGIRLEGPFWCTMIAQQVIDPDAPGFDLEGVASYWLDLRRWKHKGAPKFKPKVPKLKEWKKPFECAKCSKTDTSGTGTQDQRICWTCTVQAHDYELAQWELEAIGYNRMDAQVLLPIQRKQENKLRRMGSLELFKKMMDVLGLVLLPLQERGLLTSEKVRMELENEYKEKERHSRHSWGKLTGGTNPSSIPQLRKLFYEEWDLPKINGESTDAETIRELLKITEGSKHRALNQLLDYRHALKWRETYTKVRDKIYPAYSPATKDRGFGGKRFGAIAATGRIIAKGDKSTGTPPLQQIPLELRHLIIPPYGMKFVGADYKGQELRLIAAHTECEYLNQNLGTFFATLSDEFGIDRTRAKNLFYGLWAYGGSARAGQRALKQKGFDITIAQAQAFIERGKEKVPEIFEWHRKILAEASQVGYLVNSFGRVRRFKDLTSQRNEALNFKIQSDGADIQWEILKPCDELATQFGGHTSILMHDGFYWSIPEGSVREFIPALRALMERPFDNIKPGICFPVEIKVGSDWKEAS